MLLQFGVCDTTRCSFNSTQNKLKIFLQAGRQTPQTPPPCFSHTDLLAACNALCCRVPMCCWTTGTSVPKHSSCRVPAGSGGGGVVGLRGVGGSCGLFFQSVFMLTIASPNFAGVLEQQHVSQACKWTPRIKNKKKVHPVFVFLPYFSGKLLLWNTQLLRSALPKSCICCFYGDLQRVWKLHLAKLSLIHKYLNIAMTDMAP